MGVLSSGEACVAGRHEGSTCGTQGEWEARRALGFCELGALQTLRQGGTRPGFRFNRVTAYVGKSLAKRVKCRRTSNLIMKQPLEILIILPFYS